MRGTPKSCKVESMRLSVRAFASPRRGERSRGFSLISSLDGDNGRRLRSRKLGAKVDRRSSGAWWVATKLIDSSLQSDTLDISFGAKPPPLFLIVRTYSRITCEQRSSRYRGFDSLE